MMKMLVMLAARVDNVARLVVGADVMEMQPLGLAAALDLTHECNADLVAARRPLRLMLCGDYFRVSGAVFGDRQAIARSSSL